MDRLAFTPNSLVAGDQTLRIHCLRCGHSAPVDLRARITAGLGDHPMRRFRCSACGSPDVQTIIGAHPGWMRRMDARRPAGYEEAGDEGGGG
jgi:hypothetical protein